MRLGRRLTCKDTEFLRLPRKQLKGFKEILKVEDPIEISRNLNFALSQKWSERIHEALASAAKRLKNGATLGDLIGLDADERALCNCTTEMAGGRSINNDLLRHRLRMARGANAILHSGMRDRSVGCLECFRWLPNITALHQHHKDTNHTGMLQRL